MKTQNEWINMAKVFTGEAEAEDRKKLDEWVQKNQQNENMMNQLRKKWEAIGGDQENLHFDVDRAWSSVYQRLQNDRLISDDPMPRISRRRIPRALGVAAGIALLAAVGMSAILLLQPRKQGLEMAARTGDVQEMGIILPDGSTVDLNRESRLKYRTGEAGIREVTLLGEAYFNVRPDPRRAFVIHAGNAVIQVTGTSFSVRTHPREEKTEVYVESGRVSLYASDNDQQILQLGAGKMGTLTRKALQMESFQEPNYLAWKTGKLQFRQTPLAEVADVIQRTYQKEIRFNNNDIEDCLFTGTFEQLPVDSVVKVIQLAFDLEVDRKKEAYLFSGTGCD